MRCIETASRWHGNRKYSPLYSFASTRRIHSENHRDDILDEIDECICWIRIYGEQEVGDVANLQSMQEIVGKLPVGIQLKSDSVS